MSTLFAFLHHVAAFTLVSAVAIEFALIRGELTLASARRLQITDIVLGIAAGVLLIVGLSRVFILKRARNIISTVMPSPPSSPSSSQSGCCRSFRPSNFYRGTNR